VLGALVLGPLGLGITGAGIAAVLAGIFGALGGAICGSTDPRSELDRFARALDRGNVLVTMDIEDGYAVGDVIKAFERDGALDAGVL
jgi:hypothetical protein